MHRIFIVEDDAAIAAALQKHLTTWGFDVRCAEDFRNVLAECTAFDPQLVLLDITPRFITATTGVRSCGACRTCRSCSSPRRRTI